jgi:hypothetical protein
VCSQLTPNTVTVLKEISHVGLSLSNLLDLLLQVQNGDLEVAYLQIGLMQLSTGHCEVQKGCNDGECTELHRHHRPVWLQPHLSKKESTSTQPAGRTVACQAFKLFKPRLGIRNVQIDKLP